MAEVLNPNFIHTTQIHIIYFFNSRKSSSNSDVERKIENIEMLTLYLDFVLFLKDGL